MDRLLGLILLIVIYTIMIFNAIPLLYSLGEYFYFVVVIIILIIPIVAGILDYYYENIRKNNE